MKVGILTIAIAVLLPLAGWAGPVMDSDTDGTADPLDCCSLDPTVPSSYSCDVDQDGFCGPCDGDMNLDLVVDGFDLAPFATDLSAGADSGIGSDMNCDAVVDGFDLAPFAAQLSAGAPGPSGLPCQGIPPCP